MNARELRRQGHLQKRAALAEMKRQEEEDELAEVELAEIEELRLRIAEEELAREEKRKAIAAALASAHKKREVFEAGLARKARLAASARRGPAVATSAPETRSPQQKARKAATPQTAGHAARRAPLVDGNVVGAFRPMRVSRRGAAEATEAEKKRARLDDEGRPPSSRTRARRAAPASDAASASADAPVDATVGALLGSLWTARIAKTA